MASNTINLNGTSYTPTSISLNNVIYSSTDCKGIKLNGKIVFSFSGGGGGGGGGTSLNPTSYARLAILSKQFNWVQADIEDKEGLYFPYAGLNGMIRGNVDSRFEFCWSEGNKENTSCVNYQIDTWTADNIINYITTDNSGIGKVDSTVMTKGEEQSYYSLVTSDNAKIEETGDADDFITYIDDYEYVLKELNLKDLANKLKNLGISDNRRFLINSYNGSYGKIKNDDYEVINNSVASISFDTKRLNYIAGYSMFSSNDLQGVFDEQQQIYVIKNNNETQYTDIDADIQLTYTDMDVLLTGMDDYITAKHSNITNNITINVVGFSNSDDAVNWANTFLTNHESDSNNYVIISQFGSALYVFNNNDKYICINVNIYPNIPVYASYMYNAENTDDLNHIYEWKPEGQSDYVSFIPNNAICYYIDLSKKNQRSLLEQYSVFYNYDDLNVADSDFLIGGINYLGGGNGSLHPGDGIFENIMETYSSDITIKKEYSKLTINTIN